MKKTDVADEVAQQECSNNNCYASAYIYIYIYRCHGNTTPNLVRTQFYYFSKMP